MKQVKIKTSIMSAFIVIVSTIVFSVIFIQYKSSQEFALLTTQKDFQNISGKILNRIEQYDVSSDNFITLLKNLDEVNTLPKKAEKHPLLKVMTEYMQSSPQTYGVYIGYDNDQFYQVINLYISPNLKNFLNVPQKSRWLVVKHLIVNDQITRVEESLDESLSIIDTQTKTTEYRPSKRPWYIKALLDEKTVKTDPYIFTSLQEAGVTYARKLSESSKTVIGLDISLKSLGELLASKELVDGSGAYLFKSDGTILGQYNSRKQKSIKNLKQRYKSVFIKNGKVQDLDTQVVVKFNATKYIKFTQKLNSKYNLDENIVVFSPLETVMKPYKEKIYEILKYMIIGVVLLILPLVLIVVRLIVKPILRLEKENEKIEKGEFEKVEKVDSFMVEINHLSDSLFHMSKAIEQNQRTLEEKVQQRTKDIENLLNNAGQGFLSFNESMVIGEKYSLEAKNIFQKEIAGEKITQLLYEGDNARQLFVMSTLKGILKDDPEKQEILISLLDKEFKINGKDIEIEYKILDETNYMMILTDITTKKELSKKIQKEQQILKMVVETVTTMEQFLEVKKDYEEFVDSISSFNDLEALQGLRNSIHTFKGLFAQKEMYHIVEHLHEFEGHIDQSIGNNSVVEEVSSMTKGTMLDWLYKDIEVLESVLGEDIFKNTNNLSIDISRIQNIIKRIDNFVEENKRFRDIYSDVEQLTHDHVKVFVDPYKKLVEELSKKLDKYIEPLEIDYDTLYGSNEETPFASKTKEVLEKIEKYTNENDQFKDLSHELEKLTYHHIKVFLEPYKKLVEQLSMKLEKQIEPLALEYNDIYISNKYKPFLNTLVHVFRNSVDHGIEAFEDRYELEKPEFGVISCSVKKEQNNLIIAISDDGSGIDLEKIKQKAIDKELYSEEVLEGMDDKAILMILFEEGFSTSESVTNISGRGVGLASTLKELKLLGGDLEIQNKPLEGLKLTFSVPYEE